MIQISENIISFNSFLKEMNQIIQKVNDELALFQSACDIATSHGKFKLAFVARPDKDGLFRIIASSGETEYYKNLSISINPDISKEEYPEGISWRERKAKYFQSIDNAPFENTWKERAKKYGLKSCAIVLIYKKDQIYAILELYHCKENIFNENIKILAEELSKDITK
jgi:GAF domain-containing protein